MLSRFVSILFGAAGAVTASQAPGFTQQYMQNLDGRVAELRTIVDRFDGRLAGFGLTRAEGLEDCGAATSASVFEVLCDGIVEDVARYEALTAHQAKLRAAQDWARPVKLAADPMMDIVDATRAQFEPAVPATATGAAYAGAGFLGGWGVLTMILGLVTMPFRRREAY